MQENSRKPRKCKKNAKKCRNSKIMLEHLEHSKQIWKKLENQESTRNSYIIPENL